MNAPKQVYSYECGPEGTLWSVAATSRFAAKDILKNKDIRGPYKLVGQEIYNPQTSPGPNDAY